MNRVGLAGGLIAMAAAAAGCGEASQTVTVRLTRASLEKLDPYAPSVGLASVRVRLVGTAGSDEAVRDLGLDEDVAVFEGFPMAEAATVIVEGLDGPGNLLAFGRATGLSVTEDLDVSVAVRRNLAYVTHRPNPGQAGPDAVIYQIDLATRGLAGRVRLPGTAPSARGITARGGDELLVTFQDGAQGKVGVLSAADDTVTTIDLPRPQDLTLGAPASPIGVAVGGGVVTFVDFDAGTVEAFPRPVGGRVLDGVISEDGRRALVVVDAAPGLIQIDLEGREVESVNIIANPSGVALSQDGRQAYVTSATEREVAAVNLDNLRVEVLGGFVKPVGEATYNDALDAVLSLDVDPDNGAGRVLGFIAPADEALRVDEGVRTLNFPTGIASDGIGRRAMVVAAGTSTQTAGLTVLEARPGSLPEGASALYPVDPDDRFEVGPSSFGQRYQPSDVAVVYGR